MTILYDSSLGTKYFFLVLAHHVFHHASVTRPQKQKSPNKIKTAAVNISVFFHKSESPAEGLWLKLKLADVTQWRRKHMSPPGSQEGL